MSRRIAVMEQVLGVENASRFQEGMLQTNGGAVPIGARGEDKRGGMAADRAQEGEHAQEDAAGLRRGSRPDAHSGSRRNQVCLLVS